MTVGVGVSPSNQRLAVLLPDLGGGGAERVALALMQGFVERGHPVDLVLVNRRGVLLPLVPEDVNIVDLGARKLRQVIPPLVRYLRQYQPHALQAMMWPLPLLAVIARKLARVDTRIIGSEHTTLSTMPHGLRHPAVRAITRQAYLSADALVAVSAGVADDLASFVGVPRHKVAVIYNPLLLPDRLPDAQQMAARWPADTKRILAVGALKSEKNYPLLLRAFALVRQHVNASLLILGDGPLRGVLEQQVSDENLTDSVVFVGFETDPWPYYAAAHLFVLSSDFEGFGNVLVEAMHAGLPIISTDCPNGPREILMDGEFGTLICCGDEKALAEAIEHDLREPALPADQYQRSHALSGTEAIDKHMAIMRGP